MNLWETALSIFYGNKANSPQEPSRQIVSASIPHTSATFWQEPDQNFRLYLETFKKSTLAYMCINTRSTDIGSVYLKLLREKSVNGTTEFEEVTDHPALEILYNPNPWLSYSELMYAINANLDLTGNAFLAVENRGRELWVLPPDKVKIIGHPVNYIDHYDFWSDESGERPVRYEVEEIIHFRLYHPRNIFWGLSPLSAAYLEIYLDFQATKWASNFFKNGALVPGALKTPNRLDDKEVARIRKRWEDMHKGVENSHRIAIFDQNLSYEKIGQSLVEMEHKELRVFEREMVLAVYQTPPGVIGAMEWAQNVNLPEQKKHYWQNGLVPRETQITEILNRRLLPLWKDTKGMFFEPDLSTIEALQGSAKEKADIAGTLVSNRIITPNEARKDYLSKPAIEGGDTLNPLPGAFGNLATLASMVRGEPLIEIGSPTPKRLLEYLNRRKNLQNGGRLVLWKRFDAALSREEELFQKKIADYFRDQVKRMLKEFDELYGVEKSKRNKRIRLDDIEKIFQLAKEIEELNKKARQIIIDTISSGANGTLQELNVAISFDLTDPAVAEFIAKKLIKFSPEINAFTKEQISLRIQKAIDEGWTVMNLRDALIELYDDMTVGRAERIARTETIGAYNFGTWTGYKQSKVVAAKEWLSSRDEDVRPSHRLDWQEPPERQKIDAPFSNGLMFPGDPSGPPEEIVNCRCTTVAILEGET